MSYIFNKTGVWTSLIFFFPLMVPACRRIFIALAYLVSHHEEIIGSNNYYCTLQLLQYDYKLGLVTFVLTAVSRSNISLFFFSQFHVKTRRQQCACIYMLKPVIISKIILNGYGII